MDLGIFPLTTNKIGKEKVKDWKEGKQKIENRQNRKMTVKSQKQIWKGD